MSTSTTVTVNPRPITVTADPKTKVYGVTEDPDLTYKAVGLVPGDLLNGSLSRDPGENAGTYAINKGSLANPNYSITYNSANFEITKKPITVTALPQEIFYGDPEPELTYDVSTDGLVGEEKLDGVLVRDSGDDAGTYAITQGTLNNTSNPNYDIEYVGADFVIKQAPLIIQIKDATKVYGTTDPAFTYDVVMGEVVEGDVPTGAFERVAGENVGEYDIKQGTFTFGDNYEIFVNDGKLKIDPTQITVAADAISKVVGSEDPTLTYKITAGAVKAGDELKIAISRAVGEKVGLYEINASDQGNPNYIISFIKGIFKIIDKAIEVEVKTPKPVVANPVAQIATVDQGTHYDVVGTVDTGEPDSAGVAGNEEGASVKSATVKKEEVKKVWAIFGIAWYWWILIIAALGASAWWWFSGAKSDKDDKTTNSTK